MTRALTHREILRVFAGLATAMLMAALDQTIVATALPTIVGELGGLRALSWVVSAYLLTSTVAVPLCGKLSDLYGRMRLYQLAIVLFVAGSVACGAAQTMGQLIAFRAVQGVGGGGLVALTQTIVGDVVPARQRGRYMGYMGAVFGVASVIGPPLGGWLTDAWDWRWIFFVNVPVGALAMWAARHTLQLPFPLRAGKIDYLGAALLSGGIVALLLITMWGGSSSARSSGAVAGLAVAAVVSLVAFLLVERRAPEPILPLELFRGPVVPVAVVVLFVTNVVMFGAIVFLPLFLQIVVGVSATRSGVLLLPLVGGLLVGVVGAGRAMVRWGRYRMFPIAGTALMTVGVGLLSTMGTGTTHVEASLSMAVLGLGIGLVMQVLVVAIQNAVPPRHLGAATSTSLFFRSMGGTIGVAVAGAVLNVRLGSTLADTLRGGARGLAAGPAAVADLPAAVRDGVRVALADALTTVFLAAVPLLLVAFVLSWMLRELPLRTVATAAPRGRHAEAVDV